MRPKTAATLTTLTTLTTLAALAVTAAADPILDRFATTDDTYTGNAASPIQDIWPTFYDRGTHIDGQLKEPMLFDLQINANPFRENVADFQRYKGIRLDKGAWSPTDVDMALPAPGFRWVVGRSYNAYQVEEDPELNPGARRASNGPQGWNWFQMSMPELVKSFSGTGSSGDDLLYLIYGADRYLEFRRVETGESAYSTTTFRGTNGAAGAIVMGTDGGGDVYTYHDQRGNRMVFMGDDAGAAARQLWKIIDAAGNTAFIGDETTRATALTNGYDSSGRVIEATDTADRRYIYTYTTYTHGGSSVDRLTEVKAEYDNGGTWIEVQRVEYGYYHSINQVDFYIDVAPDSIDFGELGDLRTVTVTTPLDSGGNAVEQSYYRYFNDNWTTDSLGNEGESHQLAMVIGAEGVRTYEFADQDFSNGWIHEATEADLRPHADWQFGYVPVQSPASPHEGRLAAFASNENCGCGSSGSASDAFYDLAYSDSAPVGATLGTFRTDVTLPDLSDQDPTDGIDPVNDPATQTITLHQYFSAVGDPMTRVQVSKSDADLEWVYMVERGYGSATDVGAVTKRRSPANVEVGSYDAAAWTAAGYDLNDAGAFGLCETFARVASGDFAGFLQTYGYLDFDYAGSDIDRKIRGVSYYVDPTSDHEKAVVDFTIVRPLVQFEDFYADIDTPVAFDRTQRDFTFHGPLIVANVVTNFPAVATAENGSGVPDSTAVHHAADGNILWHRDEAGVLTKLSYTNDLLVEIIEDSGVAGPNAEFAISGTPDPRTTQSIVYDQQGRMTSRSNSDGREERWHYTTLADGRSVVLHTPHFGTVGGTPSSYSGPIAMSVYDDVGQISSTAALAIGSTTSAPNNWIDSTWTPAGSQAADIDLVAAHAFTENTGAPSGTVSEYMEYVRTPSGSQVLEQRLYHEVPAPNPSLDLATVADITIYEYNELGQVRSETSPPGTISSTAYTMRGDAGAGYTGGTKSIGIGVGLGASITHEQTGSAAYNVASTICGYWGVTSPSVGGGTGGGGEGSGSDPEPNSSFCGYWCIARVPLVLDQAESNSLYRDVWGRVVILENSFDEPDVVVERDNLGRVTSIAQYDQPPVTGYAFETQNANRAGRVQSLLSLREFFYDSRGRVYRTTVREVTPGFSDSSGGATNGTIQAGSLSYDYWYDERGDRIKDAASQLVKREFDRLGRIRRVSELAYADDATYADAKSTAGDLVVDETTLGYEEGTDDVVVVSTISRHHDAVDAPSDGSFLAGPLETGSDDDLTLNPANIDGRGQIRARWFDHLRRVIADVDYGTNGGALFDRDGLAQPTTGAPRVMQWAYGEDGRVLEAVGADGMVTRMEYDTAGRRTRVIENYVNGVAGGGTDDEEDRIVEYEYSAGLLTKVTARQVTTGGSGVEDQETVYVYGARSGDQVPQNHMLAEIRYPDSTGGSDVVLLKREDTTRRGRVTEVVDQRGTVYEISYDSANRPRTILATNGTGSSAVVQGVERTYDQLGRLIDVRSAFTPSAAAADSSYAISYEYNDWQLLSTVTQGAASLPVNFLDVQWDYVTQQLPDPAGETTTIQYTYELRNDAAMPRMLRRTRMQYPHGADDLDYLYGSDLTTSDDFIHHALSRVHRIEDNDFSPDAVIAEYDYLGGLRLISSTIKPTGPDAVPLASRLHGTASGTYDGIDQFDRIARSRWVHTGGGMTTAFEQVFTLDKVSNVTRIEDSTIPHFDASYGYDGLRRLKDAEGGNWTGSAISPARYDESWELSQLGNWLGHQLDEDADSTLELDEDNPHSFFTATNEQEDRDTDGDSVSDETMSYDANGNLAGDADYTYTYDLMNRLVKVESTGAGTPVVAEYRYNGLGYMVAERMDFDADGSITEDPWRMMVYDEDWRIVATYRGTDAHTIEPNDNTTTEYQPVETYVWHCAGKAGHGGSSLLDALVRRQRSYGADNDPLTVWHESNRSDSTNAYADTHFYMQNWRGDVVGVVNDDGGVVEHVRYTPYGRPILVSPADVTTEGTSNEVPDLALTLSDTSVFLTWWSASDARADVTEDGTSSGVPDGSVTLSDYSYFIGIWGAAGPWGLDALSQAKVDNRFGYAGYRWDRFVSKWHVRHRAYDSNDGRWLQRDPAGYVSSPNLYGYITWSPVTQIDPSGLGPQLPFPCDGGGGRRQPDWSLDPDETWAVLPHGFGPLLENPATTGGPPESALPGFRPAFDHLRREWRAPNSARPNVCVISCHANPRDGLYYIDNTGRKIKIGHPSVWPQDWIDILSLYDGVILHACFIGDTDCGQKLADRTGKPVFTPGTTTDDDIRVPYPLPTTPPIWIPGPLPLDAVAPGETLHPDWHPWPGPMLIPGEESLLPSFPVEDWEPGWRP